MMYYVALRKYPEVYPISPTCANVQSYWPHSLSHLCSKSHSSTIHMVNVTIHTPPVHSQSATGPVSNPQPFHDHPTAIPITNVRQKILQSINRSRQTLNDRTKSMLPTSPRSIIYLSSQRQCTKPLCDDVLAMRRRK